MDVTAAANASHRGHPTSSLDVMNDPAFDTNTQPQKKGPDDADTCRICRGEGNTEEPLFFPCKCSGSIKFVHQECLMEWLSHSQKKYCELCKTPFRFTKLYHPQMPNQLPTSVFCRRAIVHMLSYVVAWCRAVLVAFVWLLCLPMIIRISWSWIFWLGDAGWAREVYLRRPRDHKFNVTITAGPDGVNRTTIHRALAAGISNTTIVSLADPQEPSMLFALKKLLFGVNGMNPGTVSGNNNTIGPGPGLEAALDQSSSLLADVTWFKSLSASDSLNRLLLDILEGQIITLMVVAAFILIFLIREWVVQQQPMLNMAAFAADHVGRGQDAAAPNAEAANEARPEQPLNDRDANAEANVEVDAADDDVSSGSDTGSTGSDDDDDDEDDNDNDDGDIPVHVKRPMEISLNWPPHMYEAWRDAIMQKDRAAMTLLLKGLTTEEIATYGEAIASVREDLKLVFDPNVGSYSGQPNTGEASQQRESNAITVENGSHSISSTANSQPSNSSESLRQRPNMPSRDRYSIATEIHRIIEETHAEVPDSSSGSSDSWQDLGKIEDDLFKTSGKVKEGTSTSSTQDEPISRPDTIDRSKQTDVTPTDDLDVDPGKGSSDASYSTDVPSSSEKGKGRALEEISPAKSENNELPQQDGDIEDMVTGSSSATQSNPQPNVIEPARSSDSLGDASTQDQADTASDQIPPETDFIIKVPPPPLVTQICDWFWGDVAPSDALVNDPEPNDEHVVRDLADEAPFVAIDHDQMAGGDDDGDDDDDDGDDAENVDRQPGAAAQDPEVIRAAAAAGVDVNDQDAIEDAEDMEGILELIGQQGPITGLFQNAVFSVLLIAMTLTIAIFLPYLLGKAVLLLIGSPISVFFKIPLRFISGIADVLIDITLITVGTFGYAGVVLLRIMVLPMETVWVTTRFKESLNTFRQSTVRMAGASTERIMDVIVPTYASPDSSSQLFEIDPLWLSMRAHVVLKSIETTFSSTSAFVSTEIGDFFAAMAGHERLDYVWQLLISLSSSIRNAVVSLLSLLKDTGRTAWDNRSFTVSLTIPKSSAFEDPTLLYWGAWDRVSTILLGYGFLALVGAIYLRRGAPITSGRQGRKIEAAVTDILQQAGGIFKVILIISIEMIAFPLYCGVLLDIALLPLFAGASLHSRYNYALGSPWTAGFVHWFVGTCYMFHFALFVSMCRKIMRKGVLYFIRDPDDPTFHPVRDVLERNVTTQLRKITFSAMVYGVLIILCLGGVIWMLDRGFTYVLPIRWATNQPAFEFPLDLLFYNFLTPVVIRILKPSDVLHSVYQWWFKASARFLRLSDFLFGGGSKDEQNHSLAHIWRAWFGFGIDKGASDIQPRKIANGRFVRAPASDQVRIPRGESVFIDVDEKNQRLDGQDEATTVHGRQPDMVTMVYIPPWFKVRIFLFIASLWLFAAITGVGVTVIPLLFGRKFFSLVIPSDIEMNDIYAFSFGAYTLGGLLYAASHMRSAFHFIRSSTIGALQESLLQTLSSLRDHTFQTLSFLYVYSMMVVVLPIGIALLMQVYILIPIHTYFSSDETHVVFLIQDWTLGFLFGRIIYRTFFADTGSRPGRVMAAVMRNGHTRPNARLATRCFVLPLLLAFLAAIALPSILATLLNVTIFAGESENVKSIVFRFSFPAILATVLNLWMARELLGATARWRGLIKDEVYLIGERLHNFGEKKPGPPTNRVLSTLEAARNEGAAGPA